VIPAEWFEGMSPLWPMLLTLALIAVACYGAGKLFARSVIKQWQRSTIDKLRKDLADLKASHLGLTLEVNLLRSLTRLDRQINATEHKSIRRQVGRLLEIILPMQADVTGSIVDLNKALNRLMETIPEAELLAPEPDSKETPS
jgi:hypothetical protein